MKGTGLGNCLLVSLNSACGSAVKVLVCNLCIEDRIGLESLRHSESDRLMTDLHKITELKY